MPRHPKVKCLKAACLNSIATHMDSLWCSHFLRTMFNQSHWLHVVGPFSTLPAELVHDIYITLKSKRQLKKHHVYLLISPYLQKLDCSKLDPAELNLSLQLATSRCSKLQRLNMSWCTKVNTNVFATTMSTLDKLTHLNVSHISSLGDDFLESVAIYGEKLRELDLSYTSIGDDAVQMLVLPFDLHQRRNDRYGKCLNLVKLNVIFTSVSNSGAKILLKNLSQLAEIGYQNSLEPILELLQENPTRKFFLKSIHSSSSDIDDDSLRAVINACPNVEYLYMATYPAMNCTSLLPLTETKLDLKEIHLTNAYGVNSISIVDTLTPVLSQKGEGLASLTLLEVSEVNISLMAKLCPNMRHLSLQFNWSYTKVNTNHISVTKDDFLSHLETLQILCCIPKPEEILPFYTPDSDDLRRLLRSKNLQSIALSLCGNLTDNLMEEILDENPFPVLTELALETCHHIQFDALKPLLQSRNHLSKITLSRCQQMTRKDVDGYEKFLKKRKLTSHVKVTWD